MLREERQSIIINLLNEKGVIKVSDITDIINVTEMTVRRDLHELDKKGLLKRIHGGAKLNESVINRELSHNEKQNININAKIDIAKKISELINDGDCIFLGAGTTIELVYDYIKANYLKIVTNSIYVFNRFVNDQRYELILIGGSYRNRTGAFVGSIANDTLSKIKINKSFIGVNGIYDNAVSNYSEDEGMIQATVLNNSLEKYIIADSSKLNKNDFYHFYDLENTTAIVTDKNISEKNKERYSQYTKLIY